MVDLTRRKGASGGFTLMEMLIVIAIIAVLVAVAIPVLGYQREQAIIATNKANIRSAIAVATAEYYAGGAELNHTQNGQSFNYYDVVAGQSEYKTYSTFSEGNARGRTARDEALAGEVCSHIVVYIGQNQRGEFNVETAPFYKADNSIGSGYGSSNPFGVNEF